jgi:hypothetical protein
LLCERATCTARSALAGVGAYRRRQSFFGMGRLSDCSLGLSVISPSIKRIVRTIICTYECVCLRRYVRGSTLHNDMGATLDGTYRWPYIIESVVSGYAVTHAHSASIVGA